MLHQNLSTAPVGAPKVFKKCQIEQMNIPRHTQDNRDISTKEGWQHVVTGRAKVYDECLVVLKLCLSHSPTELAHALWGNLALSSKSEYQILILQLLKSGRPLPDKLVLGVLWDFAQNHSFAKQLTPFHIFTSLALKFMYGIPEPFMFNTSFHCWLHCFSVWNWWKFDS